MKLSLSWIAVILILTTLAYFAVYGSHVYETFRDQEQTLESFENPTLTQTSDLLITKCPAGTTSFIDKNGMTLCCDGPTEKGKCTGTVICSLSESRQSTPTCTAYREAYLAHKAYKRCPSTMPNYFESEDEKFAGCTSGKRNKTGTNTINKIDTTKLKLYSDPINTANATTWCLIFSDKNRDEGHPKSCSNIKMLANATCFPKTQTDSTKVLEIQEIGMTGEREGSGKHPTYNPATIKCKQTGQIHTCIEDKSLLRYMLATKAQTKDGNPIKTMADLDSQDKFYSCSNFEQMHILGNVAWDDVATNQGVVKVANKAAGAASDAANICQNSPNTGAAMTAFTQMLPQILQQMQHK